MAAASRTRFTVAAIFVGLATAVLLLELACQIYARAVIFPKWDSDMSHPNYFYRHSSSDVLSYELRPDTVLVKSFATLRINSHGIRDDSNDLFAQHRRVAILGDSVIFGFSHDQPHTISGRVQELVDPTVAGIKVFNFGLGGLNLAELVEFFRMHDATYDVDDVVFLLNPNDFARRNSIYEGADNGLYRIHKRPRWMTRWFARKAVYRMQKSGNAYLDWYQWFFEGNEQWGYDQLSAMASYSREQGIRFSVVLLPSAYAFSADGYKLEHLNRPLRAFLDSEGIRYSDPIERFQAGAELFYDETDHLYDPGNIEMARVMLEIMGLPEAVSIEQAED